MIILSNGQAWILAGVFALLIVITGWGCYAWGKQAGYDQADDDQADELASDLDDRAATRPLAAQRPYDPADPWRLPGPRHARQNPRWPHHEAPPPVFYAAPATWPPLLEMPASPPGRGTGHDEDASPLVVPGSAQATEPSRPAPAVPAATPGTIESDVAAMIENNADDIESLIRFAEWKLGTLDG